MNNKNSYPTPFNEIQWHKLAMVFLCKKNSNTMKSHPISVFQAIIKAVSSQTPAFSSMNNPDMPIFHIHQKKHTYKMNPHDQIRVDFLFFKQSKEEISLWRWNLMEYLSEPVYSETVEIHTIGQIEDRNFHRLAAEWEELPGQGELCLEILTPLPFYPKKGNTRVHISKQKFIRLFEKRFSLLLGRPMKYEPGRDDFTILPYYWRYTEIKRKAKSQPGTTQYINGTVGKLYIKGTWQNFLPFLLLGSEIHTGTKLANSQGYYRILDTPPPYFAAAFPEPKSLIFTIREIIDTYDHAAQGPAQQELYPPDEQALAEKLFPEIKNNSYVPEPNTAFLIRQENKKDRLVEQMNPIDLIVARYLAKTIYKVFDNIYDESSIGNRKGVSLNRALEIAKKACAEGYGYTFQWDMEDFFPFIHLEELHRILDYYLPDKDEIIKGLLKKLAGNGYVLEDQYHERVKGLALGNPLSPFLANLYLDTIQKKVKAMDVRFIRYLDTIIAFCKCPADGESVLKILATEGTEATERVAPAPYNSTRNTHTPKEKSWNKNKVSEVSNTEAAGGCTLKRPSALRKATVPPKSSLNCSPILLHYNHENNKEFIPGNNNNQNSSRESIEAVDVPDLLDSIKKPLIISEPQLSLGLMGDWLIIKDRLQLINVLPLRKISAIEIKSNTLVSASVLKILKAQQVPLSIRLISGHLFPVLGF